MRVNEDGGAEEGVGHRVERSSCERSNGEGNETDRNGAFEGPVVGAVSGRGVRNWSCIVC